MADIWSKAKRREVMSKIRSKNTKPELLLRKALFAIIVWECEIEKQLEEVLSKIKTELTT